MGGHFPDKNLIFRNSNAQIVFADRDKAIGNRQQLEGQLTENRMVKEELDLLEADAVVYKQIGPALIKQDMQEAKLAVGRRLEYIQKEW